MFGVRDRKNGEENWSVKIFIALNIMIQVIGFVIGYTFPVSISWDLEDRHN